ncbi:MAG: DsbC family protein [Gammaproteobacteria bacterium]
MIPKKSVLHGLRAVAAGVVLAFPVMAGAAGLDAPAGVLASLNKILPGHKPDAVTPTPVKGLYQISYGPLIFYMSADGKYLFDGNLVNVNTHENLTEAASGKARAEMLAGLDPSRDMIVYAAKGKTKHVITVFTDIDCPYCQRLHTEVPELTRKGVEVRYMFFPRAGIGSSSYKKAVDVWCSKDRKAAMTAAIQGNVPSAKSCDNPVAFDYEIGQKLGVNGTPAIVLQDGTLIPGYQPADKLIALMDRLSAQKMIGLKD